MYNKNSHHVSCWNTQINLVQRLVSLDEIGGDTIAVYTAKRGEGGWKIFEKGQEAGFIEDGSVITYPRHGGKPDARETVSEITESDNLIAAWIHPAQAKSS